MDWRILWHGCLGSWLQGGKAAPLLVFSNCAPFNGADVGGAQTHDACPLPPFQQRNNKASAFLLSTWASFRLHLFPWALRLCCCHDDGRRRRRLSASPPTRQLVCVCAPLSRHDHGGIDVARVDFSFEFKLKHLTLSGNNIRLFA